MVKTRGGIKRRGYHYPPRSRTGSDTSASSVHSSDMSTSSRIRKRTVIDLEAGDAPRPKESAVSHATTSRDVPPRKRSLTISSQSSLSSISSFSDDEEDIPLIHQLKRTTTHTRTQSAMDVIDLTNDEPSQSKSAIPSKPTKFTDSRLGKLPNEIMDLILSNDLTPIDHLNIASTCKTFAKVYTQNVFHALQDVDYWTRRYDKPREWVVSHIWTGGTRIAHMAPSGYPDSWQLNINNDTFKQHLWSFLQRNHQGPFFADYYNSLVQNNSQDAANQVVLNVIANIGKTKLDIDWRGQIVKDREADQIARSVAKAVWKVTDTELSKIYDIPLKKQGFRKTDAKCVYFNEDVRKLAYRVHGGPAGHDAYIKRLEQRATKAKETKTRKNAEAQAEFAAYARHSNAAM